MYVPFQWVKIFKAEKHHGLLVSMTVLIGISLKSALAFPNSNVSVSVTECNPYRYRFTVGNRYRL